MKTLLGSRLWWNVSASNYIRVMFHNCCKHGLLLGKAICMIASWLFFKSSVRYGYKMNLNIALQVVWQLWNHKSTIVTAKVNWCLCQVLLLWVYFYTFHTLLLVIFWICMVAVAFWEDVKFHRRNNRHNCADKQGT
jgi:uncharacterized membrane protein YbaN (DUF454 family)